MEYGWKRQVAKIEAQVVGEALEEIRNQHGGSLSQEDIVRESEAEDAPLHTAFEWRDTVAGHKYRLEQAKLLVRCVVIVSDDEGRVENPVRAFVSVVEDETRHYTSTIHAMSDCDLRQQILEKALSDLKSWQRKYSDLKELAGMFAIIDVAIHANTVEYLNDAKAGKGKK